MELARIACIAPPLSDETLANYRSMIDSLDSGSELRDALEMLYNCVMKWWEAPVSAARAFNVETGTDLTRGPTVKVQPFDVATIRSLWEHTLWMREILAIESMVGPMFESTGETPLKTMVYHLIWHAKEITLDREPITTDRIVS